MKKLTMVIMAGLILLSCCKTKGDNLISREPLKLEINKKSTVVCFGDSLTYGHGADSIETSFPMLLQKRISIPVINSGVNDDTTADGLKRIERDVLDHDPVIVLIDFGGNDIYNSKPKLSIKEIENNFKEMLRILDNGNMEIFLIRYYNNQMRIFDILFKFDRMLERIQKEYPNVKIIKIFGKAYGAKRSINMILHTPTARGMK
jgi:lysophospholipase L1-like esterase